MDDLPLSTSISITTTTTAMSATMILYHSILYVSTTTMTMKPTDDDDDDKPRRRRNRPKTAPFLSLLAGVGSGLVGEFQGTKCSVRVSDLGFFC